MNTQVMKGNWSELKGRVKEKWGQLTDQELTEAEGNFQQLVGLIQRKTGQARERIETELNEMVEGHPGSSGMGRASEAMRGFAESAGTQAQHAYEQMSERMRGGYEQAEMRVQERPFESLAVAFGSGLITGLVIGLMIRSR